jgi:hypothetical protein
MRVGFGLFFLLIAAFLGWATFNWSLSTARNDGMVGKALGTYQQSQDMTIMFGVGTVIFGILAVVVLAVGGGRSSAQTPPTRQADTSVANPQPHRREESKPTASSRLPVEQRLATLKELLSKGLISEQEYQARRHRILEDI